MVQVLCDRCQAVRPQDAVPAKGSQLDEAFGITTAVSWSTVQISHKNVADLCPSCEAALRVFLNLPPVKR
jgi:hypothetical protein